MLGIVDPNTGTLRLFWLFVFNLIAVLLLTGLIMRNLIPLYPSAPIAYLALFVANVLVSRRSTRRRANVLETPGWVVKLLWLGGVMFTPAGVAAIVAWMRRPDLPSTVQAVIGVLLVVYIWFLLFRLRRSSKAQADQR